MKTILKSLLAFCFYSIACLAGANDLATADKLYDQGKVREALQIYLRPELNQDAFTQNRIAYIYEKEYKDDKKAVEWYRKAANQGDMNAQYNLGLMYRRGTGVTQDYQQAFYWFSKAAEQNVPEAMVSIGVLYEDGNGVEKDELKALNWYVKGAEKGNRIGQCNAAGMFMHSTTIPKDYQKAHVLLDSCLKNSPADNCCLERTAVLYSMGWGVEKNQQKAHGLRTKAAANGNEVAMYMLGRDFDYGIGVEKDSKAAMDWYQKAAARDHAKAMYRLYEVYEYGKLGQAVDKAKAREWKARAEKAMKEQGLSRNALMDKFRMGMEEQE